MDRMLRDADGEVYSRNWLTQLWKPRVSRSAVCKLETRKPETGGQWGKSQSKSESQTRGPDIREGEDSRSSSAFSFNLGPEPVG